MSLPHPPRLLLGLLLLTTAASAQLASLEIDFQGSNCVPCLDSMPERARRLRGVATAAVIPNAQDPASGTLKVTFLAENRLRVEQLRDLIQQDGTKTVRARLQASGTLEKGEKGEKGEAGKWQFRMPRQALPLEIKTTKPLKAEETVSLQGTIADLSRSPLLLLVD